MAIELFLRDGYSQTTVAAIAAASGVGITSFFRYFSAKGDIVWAEFDAHTKRLHDRLANDESASSILTVVRAVVLRTLGEDLDNAGLSLLRFELFDRSPELRSEESRHWSVWAEQVSRYVAKRSGGQPDEVTPAVVGAAIQATMLAVLRRWAGRVVDPEAILNELDHELARISNLLEPLA